MNIGELILFAFIGGLVAISLSMFIGDLFYNRISRYKSRREAREFAKWRDKGYG